MRKIRKPEGKLLSPKENIAQAESDKQDALDALDQEIATREATFNVWVEQISSMGLRQLKEALQNSPRHAEKKKVASWMIKKKLLFVAQIKTLEKKSRGC